MRPTSFTHVMGPSGPVSFGTEADAGDPRDPMVSHYFAPR